LYTPFFIRSDLFIGSEYAIVHMRPTAKADQLTGPLRNIHRPNILDKSEQKCTLNYRTSLNLLGPELFFKF